MHTPTGDIFDLEKDRRLIDEMKAGDEDFENHFVPIPKARPGQIRAKKVGRNGPCPCGSGKKFKACCMGRASSASERRQLAAEIEAVLEASRASS